MSRHFEHIVVADFEYEVSEGDLPDVLCMVAHVLDENLRHVRTIRQWRGEFGRTPPFDISKDTLFVAYSAWAEMTCFQALGVAIPGSYLRPAHRLSRRQQLVVAIRSGRQAKAAEQEASGRVPSLRHRWLGAHGQGHDCQGHR